LVGLVGGNCIIYLKLSEKKEVYGEKIFHLKAPYTKWLSKALQGRFRGGAGLWGKEWDRTYEISKPPSRRASGGNYFLPEEKEPPAMQEGNELADG